MSDQPSTASNGATPGTAAAAPSAPSAEPDWTDQVADLVVDTVDRIHDKVTGPVLMVAKGAVYGALAALIAVVVLALLLITVIRVLDWALPFSVWLPYLILGTLLSAAGLLLWRQRKVTA